MDEAQISPEIVSFLNNIIDKSGVSTDDVEVRTEMVRDLYDLLDSRIVGMISDSLDEESFKEYLALIENKAPANEVESFLAQKVPDMKEKLKQLFLDFQGEYLERTETHKAS